MKSYQPKKKDIERAWHLVDLKNKVLGREATRIVKLLMGKHKADYAPHMDMGDCVVVINAKEVVVTGNKEKQKVYYRHSGFPGGFKEIAFSKLRKENPERIIELAVKRMLPDNRLRNLRLRRMFVFAESEHPYKDKFNKEK